MDNNKPEFIACIELTVKGTYSRCAEFLDRVRVLAYQQSADVRQVKGLNSVLYTLDEKYMSET